MPRARRTRRTTRPNNQMMLTGSSTAAAVVLTEKDDGANVSAETVASSITLGYRVFEALPPQQLVLFDEKERTHYEKILKEATDVKSVVNALIQLILAHQGIVRRKLLARLDNDRYAGLWSCPRCQRRWGRHDPETGECPTGKYDVDV